MDYESFVAYSIIAIVVVVAVAFLYWVEKDNREYRKRRKEIERKNKAIENAIIRQLPLNERNEIFSQSSHLRNEDHRLTKGNTRAASHDKGKKAKPEWWRFLTEESIGSLLEKRRRKKAEGEACKNDPWSSL